MILSGNSIKLLVEKGTIQITPPPVIKEASIKIHLSNQFAKIGEEYQTFTSYKLQPKEFILALSKEKITLPMEYAGLYDGYTHLARKGIITHLGSMFVDPGTDNQITLEIFNASDKEILLEEGIRVGHLVILEVK